MSRAFQFVREAVDFDSRLRNPVYWLLWSATAFLIAVLVFDWRPPEFLEPLFVASIFLPGIAAIALLLLLLSLRLSDQTKQP